MDDEYGDEYEDDLDELTDELRDLEAEVDELQRFKYKVSVWVGVAVAIGLGVGAIASVIYSELADAQKSIDQLSLDATDYDAKAKKAASRAFEEERKRLKESIRPSQVAALPLGTVLAITKPWNAHEDSLDETEKLLVDAGFVYMRGNKRPADGTIWGNEDIQNMSGRFLMGEDEEHPVGTPGEATMDEAGEHDHGGVTDRYTPPSRVNAIVGSPKDGHASVYNSHDHKIEPDGSHTHANNRPKFLTVQYWLKVK